MRWLIGLPYASTHADELSIVRPGQASPKYTRVALGKYDLTSHSLPCNNGEADINLAYSLLASGSMEDAVQSRVPCVPSPLVWLGSNLHRCGRPSERHSKDRLTHHLLQLGRFAMSIRPEFIQFDMARRWEVSELATIFVTCCNWR
jgi:hypothetical protein